MSHMNDDDPLLNNDVSQAKRPWRLSEVGIVKRCPCLPRCCCVLLGLILLALSVQIFFLPGLIKQIVRDTLEDSLIFKYPSNSSSYKAWISNTGSDGVPIWMEMRFFNVTNKDDVIQKGAYPQINLTEPLVYNEFQIKEHVNFSDNGEWVEYNLWTYYTFNKDRSKLQRNDTVIVFSPLLAAVLHAYEKGDDLDRLLFKLVLKDINENPELLFVCRVLLSCCLVVFLWHFHFCVCNVFSCFFHVFSGFFFRNFSIILALFWLHFWCVADVFLFFCFFVLFLFCFDWQCCNVANGCEDSLKKQQKRFYLNF